MRKAFCGICTKPHTRTNSKPSRMNPTQGTSPRSRDSILRSRALRERSSGKRRQFWDRTVNQDYERGRHNSQPMILCEANTCDKRSKASVRNPTSALQTLKNKPYAGHIFSPQGEAASSEVDHPARVHQTPNPNPLNPTQGTSPLRKARQPPQKWTGTGTPRGSRQPSSRSLTPLCSPRCRYFSLLNS